LPESDIVIQSDANVYSMLHYVTPYW